MKKIFKNRLIAASFIFLFMNLASSFLIMAPLLVLLRNHFDKSAIALKLWPVIQPHVLADILVNDSQMLATFAVSAIVIYVLCALLRTLFSGGAYGIIIGGESARADNSSPIQEFMNNSIRFWPGFLRVSLLAAVAYFVAIFLGLTIGQLLSGLGPIWQISLLILLLLMASTYIQILRAAIVAANDSSVMNAIRTTRPLISSSLLRLAAGNISVAVAGIILTLILWRFLGNIRNYNWNAFTGISSTLLEQAIIFVVGLAQTIRINYNYSVIKRGTKDVVGGN